jgi:hypothetical protein
MWMKRIKPNTTDKKLKILLSLQIVRDKKQSFRVLRSGSAGNDRLKRHFVRSERCKRKKQKQSGFFVLLSLHHSNALSHSHFYLTHTLAAATASLYTSIFLWKKKKGGGMPKSTNAKVRI